MFRTTRQPTRDNNRPATTPLKHRSNTIQPPALRRHRYAHPPSQMLDVRWNTHRAIVVRTLTAIPLPTCPIALRLHIHCANSTNHQSHPPAPHHHHHRGRRRRRRHHHHRVPTNLPQSVRLSSPRDHRLLAQPNDHTQYRTSSPTHLLQAHLHLHNTNTNDISISHRLPNK
jgi:hypothetical protein